MTERKILLLQEICQADQKVYAPESSSLIDLRDFDELVASLQEKKKTGWIELEVEKSGKLIRGYLRRYKRPRLGARRTVKRRSHYWVSV